MSTISYVAFSFMLISRMKATSESPKSPSKNERGRVESEIGLEDERTRRAMHDRSMRP